MMILGITMISWITSCGPTNHSDVQIKEFHTDTVSTPDTAIKEIK